MTYKKSKIIALKKLILIVFMFSFMLTVAGCSDGLESQYDEDTNQKISALGISFQIPKAWDQKHGDDENLQFYDGDNDSFNHGITFSMTEEVSLEEEADTFESNLKNSNEMYHDLRGLDFVNDSVGNMPAVRISYTRKWDNKDYIYELILFQKNEDVISIQFFSIDKAGIDDFEKVLDSIAIE